MIKIEGMDELGLGESLTINLGDIANSVTDEQIEEYKANRTPEEIAEFRKEMADFGIETDENGEVIPSS